MTRMDTNNHGFLTLYDITAVKIKHEEIAAIRVYLLNENTGGKTEVIENIRRAER